MGFSFFGRGSVSSETGTMLSDGGRDGELERVDALAGDCGDVEERELAALGDGGELFELFGIGDVGLGGDDDGGLGGSGSKDLSSAVMTL